jgi:hypothetical protein
LSFLKSSATRWFEALLEDAKRRVTRRARKLRLEAIASNIARLGDFVFPRLVHLADIVSRAINRLQLTMIESMLIASLLFGVLALTIILVFTLRAW